VLSMKKPEFLNSLAGGSGVMAAVTAKLACPICYPAIAGLLSSMGLGSIITQSQMELFSAALVAVALFGLFYRAKERRGYRPAMLGTIFISAALLGRFSGLDFIFFSGLGGFISMSIWNVWPKKKRSCSQCVDEQGASNKSAQKGVLYMSAKRKVEVFSAGCPACDETIKLVNDNSCPSCEVTVLDVNETSTKDRMKSLGIKSIPAVVIDGTLASCCSGRGPNLNELKAAGLGSK